jgi:hypothetical protein
MPEMISIQPVPFMLRWVRQGKAAWRRDWVDQYGPSRTHIPGLDEHIAFANYDLELNGLPRITKDASGEPYVMAIRPLTEAEMSQVHSQIYLEFAASYNHLHNVELFFTRRVIRPLLRLASLLDSVAYHGFVPAEDSPGLREFRSLLPPQETEVVFPDGPEAGI